MITPVTDPDVLARLVVRYATDLRRIEQLGRNAESLEHFQIRRPQVVAGARRRALLHNGLFV
ncbi:MAG: hypothetical protein ACRD3C_02930, partial [Vicinamibacterales bacterium]